MLFILFARQPQFYVTTVQMTQEFTLFCPRSLFNFSIVPSNRETAAGVMPGILLAWPRLDEACLPCKAKDKQGVTKV
jgi:hypothetical protein